MTDKNLKHIKDYTLMATITTIFLLLILVGLSNADEYAIKTIAYEASNQSYAGQVAVASVIKTRMQERHLTAMQIVLQPKQFSCWKNGKPIQSRKIKGSELAIATKAWHAATIGKYNHYAHYKINNYWTKKAKAKMRIGDHIFYKL